MVRAFTALLLVLGISAQSYAAEETPLELSGVTVVTAEQLQPILDQGIFIYDLRKKASFVDGHVPSAQSAAAFYDAARTTLDTSFLGPNKSDRILFYSHGTTGWKSYWAAKRAVEAGYENVMWMRGGFAEWAGNGFPIAR
ncbi:rhodanese-like domain-containing protein [Pelagibius sp.]|uniref:rhodanese-like domain-containing protein n=1 Tax=Pelagibius sp. TaxID=1931238 RepID=UPI00261C4D90|nr:rhodanese-like domain-containing protein [Pelagibius sp.]